MKIFTALVQAFNRTPMKKMCTLETGSVKMLPGFAYENMSSLQNSINSTGYIKNT